MPDDIFDSLISFICLKKVIYGIIEKSMERMWNELFINRNIKYRDILIFALIGVIGYKLIDNYNFFFDIGRKVLSIMSPFIYAIICAYILNPVVSFLRIILKLEEQYQY